MQLLDQHLKEIVDEGLATFEEAVGKASNPGEFEKTAGGNLAGGGAL